MQRLLPLIAFLYCTTLMAQTPAPSYREPWRPQFHFSSAANWINDPNGLLYYHGEYHLFFQHNPFGNVWGHMSWGHAVSTDLVHWRHLPIALREENGVMAFSGTCIADTNNTSGLGKKGEGPLIAIFTGHTDTRQAQYLAYSNDRGRTWTKYAGNPILDLHKKDFRDPKVFWYAPKKYWVMVLMLPDQHKVQVYSSNNLKRWTHRSDFGPAGDTTGVWECPDLSPIPVAGDSTQKKWVLLTSQNASMQYFVGDFDGVAFTPQNPAGAILRPDYGPDYYAAISYNELPDTISPVSIGWVNNWNYANDIPTTPWKGAMSLPRNLSVKKTGDTWVLLQQPIAALQALRKAELPMPQNELLGGTKPLSIQSQQLEIDLCITPAASANVGVRLAAGNGHEVVIGYDAAKKLLYLDRGKTVRQSFSKAFEARKRFETPVQPDGSGIIRLHIFFDHSIVEVFAGSGEAVMTAQVFPDNTDNGVELFSNGGNSRVNALKIWELNPAW
jgi:fructan beta-fructosidase